MTGIEEVALYAAVAGAAVSAVGAVQSGQAQKNASNYNATIAAQNAATAEAQGEAAAQAQQRDTQRRLGGAVAAYGASGVDVGAGSAADVLADSTRQATLDNLTTKYNYKLRAVSATDQSELDKANASNSSTAGYLSAVGIALQGGSNAYYRNKGGSGGTGVPTTG